MKLSLNFQDGDRCGDSDGEFLGTRYFSAAPNSSIFTTIEHLLPYNDKLIPLTATKTKTMKEDVDDKESTYFPPSSSNAISGYNMPQNSFSEKNKIGKRECVNLNFIESHSYTRKSPQTNKSSTFSEKDATHVIGMKYK